MLADCIATEAASALPLKSGNQMAKSTATNCLNGRNIRSAWQNSARLSIKGVAPDISAGKHSRKPELAIRCH